MTFAVNVEPKELDNGARRYRVIWRPAGAYGPRRVVTFADLDHAELYASLVRVRQREPELAELVVVGLADAPSSKDATAHRPGCSPDPAPGKTLIEACEAYLDSLQGVVLPNTLDGYRTGLRQHLAPFFATTATVGHPGLMLAAVTREHLRDWQTWMVGRRSIKTIKNVKVAVLGPTLKAAMRKGDDGSPAVRDDNPLEGLRAPRQTGPRKRRGFVEGDRAAIYFTTAYAIDSAAADVLLFAAATGLRRSEIWGLRPDAVDLDTAMVTVRRVSRRQGLGQPRGRSWAVEDDTKTDAGDRSVPIPTELLPMLARRVQAARHAEAGLVFPNPRTGGLWLGTAWQRFMDKLHQQLDAGPAGDPRRVTAHGWRHAYKSWMAAAGIDPSSQAAALGHAGPEVGDRVYFHMTQHGRAQIAAAIGPVVAELRPIGEAA